MTSLSIKKLQEFFSYSSYITLDKSNLIPILEYLKIEIEFGICVITKANSNSFCRIMFDTDQEDTMFYIKEKNFKDFCELSKQDKVNITVKDKKVMLSDGGFKQEFSTSIFGIDDFPNWIPSTEGEGEDLQNEALTVLKSAKEHLSTDQLRPEFNCVYLTEDHMIATDANVAYIRKFPINTPSIAFSEVECRVLCNFENAKYLQSANYNVYKFGPVTYGFVQSHGAKPFNFRLFQSYLKGGENKFEINTDSILTYCLSTERFCNKEGYITCGFSTKDSIATLIYLDAGLAAKNQMDFPCTVVGDGFEFNFSPYVWKKVLASLPYSSLTIHDGGMCVFLTSKEDPFYFGLIQKMQL